MTTNARSILVDGAPVARIGDVVLQIVPHDPGRAWILAYTQRHGCPAWRVWDWSLADGAVTPIAEGGDHATVLSPGGRVFIGQLATIGWHDLHTGRHGEVHIDDDRGALACTPDGRHFLTRRI